jgi:aminoglycoside 6'-N-acetyltransferase
LRALPEIVLRPATVEDIVQLDLWDEDPDVIAATTDDEDAKFAFEDADWQQELEIQDEHYRYYIAELSGRPVGAMLVIDPERERTHYWGDIEPNLRAIDIWIGAAEDRGRGHGTIMMELAIDKCFSDSSVEAIVIDPLASNTRAHRFYERLGFVPEGRRHFGDDDCLVHRLTRAAWQSRIRNTIKSPA